MVASCVEPTNYQRSANNITKGASKVDGDVSKTLMVVSEVIADGTIQKVSIIGYELKDALKRMIS